MPLVGGLARSGRRAANNLASPRMAAHMGVNRGDRTKKKPRGQSRG
jgi:hypothetical protein